jgi:hypothetical protein
MRGRRLTGVIVQIEPEKSKIAAWVVPLVGHPFTPEVVPLWLAGQRSTSLNMKWRSNSSEDVGSGNCPFQMTPGFAGGR